MDGALYYDTNEGKIKAVSNVKGSSYTPRDVNIDQDGIQQQAAPAAPTAEEQAAAAAIAKIAGLRGEIGDKGTVLQQIYDAMFGDLSSLVKERSGKLEADYGKQFEQTAKQYADALPQIENSYAAIGAADSTDTSDAKDSAKEGFDSTTATIGQNKEKDLTAIGQYSREERAKIEADRDAAKRNVARAGETDDEDALRQMRNELEGNIDDAKVTRATLGTDKGARGSLSKLTEDGGRYDQAVNALDSIIKSSMSGAVKEAAVKTIVDNAGLDPNEKEKINAMYGNVYAEQQQL